jgi:guanylate kinase
MPNSAKPHRGLMFVLSSPSGAGKSTLARRLLQDEPTMSLSISATTRAPRASEQEGREYYFVDRPRFEAMAAAGELLEWAVVFDNFYGTPRAKVEEKLAAGHDVLFDVDWQGARALRAAAPDDVVGVFILPPSTAELERRLKKRAEDAPDVIARRMARSAGEIEHWKEYDYVIVNYEVEDSLTRIKTVLGAERLKRQRETWLGPHVDDLLSGK